MDESIGLPLDLPLSLMFLASVVGRELQGRTIGMSLEVRF